MHINTLPYADTDFVAEHVDQATGDSLCWFTGVDAGRCNRRAAVHFLAEVPGRTNAAGEAMACAEHFMDSRTNPDRRNWPVPVWDAPVISQHPYNRFCSDPGGYYFDADRDTWICAGCP